MGLTDLEIFMKLQDDMYNSILGYGNPELDIEGYFGVDIGQNYGSGVCRNMADDIVNKLNAINPDYNARMFAVKASPGNYDKPNIQQNIVDPIVNKGTKFDETQMRNMIFVIELITENEDIFDLLGNHAVVAVDLKKENITLIIDPTNICLGVFKDGEITIFNSLDKENPLDMYRTPLDDISYRGIQSLQVPFEYAKSFLNPFASIDELNEKYGIDAQKVALESAKAKEENYIYQSSKKNNFKDNLKVNLETSESTIYSTEELENLFLECIKQVSNITTSEEAIELANICRKMDYSIKYYNQKQEEIIGKDINYYATISNRLNLNMPFFKECLAKKLIETNAVVLPENDEIKELLCIGYLQAGSQEQIQDLKVSFDETKKYYYIINNDTLLATLRMQYGENEDLQSVSYHSHNIKINKELNELLTDSVSIIDTNTQIKNTEIKSNIDDMINER